MNTLWEKTEMATKTKVPESAIIPIHQWTNGGDEVLVVRFVSKDGKSSSDRLVNGEKVSAEPFQHPMAVGETVTASDWDSSAKCGGGIHGWPWAMSLGDGKDCDWDALWQVYAVKPKDIVVVEPDAPGKIKFRIGILRFLGTWDGATNFVLAGQMAWVHHAASGAASATGWGGAASATGKSGAASTTGWSGAASATGERGAASATGWGGAAFVTGTSGRAKAGEFGCIALAWWNSKKNRQEMRCALTGKDQQCKADVWYQMDDDGNFECCLGQLTT